MATQKLAPANKGRRYPVEILTPDEVNDLLRSCSSRAPTGIRNQALIATLYRCGLRISEALALKPKDLDSEAGTVNVLRGKGKKARMGSMDPTAFAMVDRWIERRAILGISKRARIFCTLKGQPLKDSYVRALLPRLAAKAGIEKRVHAHGLRHTMASELAREGQPMNLIQAQLGHSNLGTTSRYLAHIAPGELIQAMRNREWST